MTEAMPFLQKYDITFLRPPPFVRVVVRLSGFQVAAAVAAGVFFAAQI